MASKKKSKKKTKKKVTRRKKTTAKKAPARKKVAKKKAAKKTAARKKTAKRKPAKKKSTKKRSAKKTTAADLRKRAEQAEIEVKVETEAQQPQPGAAPMAAALGGLTIPSVDLEGLDLAGVQESVKGIVDFVEDNPVAAAAVALGAGVVLTSLYWDKSSGKNKP